MFSFFGKKSKEPTASPSRTQENLSKLSQASQELLQAYSQNEERYYTVRYVGEGGFGSVSCSFDQNLYRATALKKLHRQFRDDQQQLQAILNEVRLISYLDHPGVIPIYDAFISPDGDFCYTMKLLEGDDLETVLIHLQDQGQRMPLARAVKLLNKLSETLAFVHDKGVLHLDIKPSNIMLGRYGEVCILDWGIAHLYDATRYQQYLKSFGKDQHIDKIIHDRSNRIEGTIAFMSPEQTEQQRNQLTPASDIFSTGVVIYHALTGNLPFSDENLERFFYDLHQVEPPPLHEVRGDIPLRLSQICAKMLEKDVHKRYQSFHAVLKDLEDFSSAGQVSEQRLYQPGDVLIQEGEIGDQVFQIIDGLVEISVQKSGQKNILTTRGSGTIVGELSIFTKEPRSATVTALQPTTVKLLNETMIMEELEKLNPWIGHMIYQLSKRFLEQNQTIISLEEELRSLRHSLDSSSPFLNVSEEIVQHPKDSRWLNWNDAKKDR